MKKLITKTIGNFFLFGFIILHSCKTIYQEQPMKFETKNTYNQPNTTKIQTKEGHTITFNPDQYTATVRFNTPQGFHCEKQLEIVVTNKLLLKKVNSNNSKYLLRILKKNGKDILFLGQEGLLGGMSEKGGSNFSNWDDPHEEYYNEEGNLCKVWNLGDDEENEGSNKRYPYQGYTYEHDSYQKNYSEGEEEEEREKEEEEEEREREQEEEEQEEEEREAEEEEEEEEEKEEYFENEELERNIRLEDYVEKLDTLLDSGRSEFSNILAKYIKQKNKTSTNLKQNPLLINTSKRKRVTYDSVRRILSDKLQDITDELYYAWEDASKITYDQSEKDRQSLYEQYWSDLYDLEELDQRFEDETEYISETYDDKDAELEEIYIDHLQELEIASEEENSKTCIKGDRVDPKKISKMAEIVAEEMRDKYGKDLAVCNFGVATMLEYVTGDKSLHRLNANLIYDFLAKSPKWQEIKGPEGLQNLANEGHIIIPVWKNLKNRNSSGHVAMIVPGKEVESKSWGCMVPCAFDTGAKKREACKPLSFSFGKNKKKEIKYYIFKNKVS